MAKYGNQYCSKPKYGFGHFLLDFILICLTGGLWFLWIILRYLRRNTR